MLKSCTTWDLRNPIDNINNRINYLSTGAGFQPSTVSTGEFAGFQTHHQQYHIPHDKHHQGRFPHDDWEGKFPKVRIRKIPFLCLPYEFKGFVFGGGLEVLVF